MRVLHIIHDLTVGGAEKLVYDLLKTAKSFDLLILKSSNSSLVSDLKQQGISVFSLEISNLYNPNNTFKIRNFMLKHEYDIIHAHLFPILYFVAIAKVLSFGKLKSKLIYTEHSTTNSRRKYRLFKPLEKWIYRKYDVIISISEAVNKELCQWIYSNYVETDKMTVIHNAIDFMHFNNADTYDLSLLFGISPKSTTLLMTARFTKAKDHKTLLEALRLLKDRSLDVNLLLVGDGTTRVEIEQIIKKLNLVDSVFLLGNRIDVAQVIKSVDICILSSHWEGFGLSVLEYMAAGKPVIASDVPGLKDIVGTSGLLFQVGNVNDLAENIELLMRDNELFKDLSSKGIQKAKTFDLPAFCEHHRDAYNQVLKK